MTTWSLDRSLPADEVTAELVPFYAGRTLMIVGGNGGASSSCQSFLIFFLSDFPELDLDEYH
jgi:hypothetical protein